MDETTPGREPIQIVEIVQPRCGLTYGSAPCTAAVGVTGQRECFNTRKTCQDTANYNAKLGPNIAANPGFEAGDTDWFKLGNWAISVNANARTGSWVASKPPGTNVSIRNDTASAGLIACAEGDLFEAVCWAKASGVTDGTCRVGIQWLDADLASLSFTNGPTTPLTTSYQQLSVEGTAPANTAFCRISILPGTVIATDTIYVDDAELRRADPHSITWRFVKPAQLLPGDLFEAVGTVVKTHPIPSLLSVSTSPTKINIGGGSEDSSPLGRRASVSVVLQDHPWDDSVEDKYLSERDYLPMARGTFWSKFQARNPFHARWPVRVIEGYLGQDLAAMQQRTYLLQSIDGPDASGRVVVTAKDPLGLADEKRTQFPQVSDITLDDAIDSSQTTGINVVAVEDELTSDYGNTGSTRYVRIDNEILSYTGQTGSDTSWELTGVARGVLGTTADAHADEAKCQRVGRYDDMLVWDLAKDLLLGHTLIDASFVDEAQWDDEGERYLSPFNLTGTVAEPTPVSKLLGELTEQCPFYMWWDEREQKIFIKAVRPPLGDGVVEVDDDSHIIAGSSVLREDPSQRLSRVFLYYKLKDPTQALNDIGNYSSVRGRVDPDAESDAEHGEVRVRQIFSRWLITAAQAIHTTTRVLSRFRDQVRFLSVKLDAKDRSISTADVIEVTTRTVVDDTGEPLPRLWQVVSLDEVVPGEVVRYDLQEFTFRGRIWIWADESAPDYDVATEQERRDNAYIADEDGNVGAGADQGYRWV